MKSAHGQMLAIIFMFLQLSVDPINAYRVKVTNKALDTASAKAKATESHGFVQDLVKELKKATERNTHMAKKVGSNSTELYPGEYWADCAQRKEDFLRRTDKTKARLDLVKGDGEVTLSEYGWVMLKAHKMMQTYMTADEQGCEWVRDGKGGADNPALAAIHEETKGDVPCYAHGMAYLKANPNKPDVQADFLLILMSEDCKVPAEKPDLPAEGQQDIMKMVQMEQKEQSEAMEAAEKLKAQLKASQGGSLTQSSEELARTFKTQKSVVGGGQVLKSGWWSDCAQEGGFGSASGSGSVLLNTVCKCPEGAAWEGVECTVLYRSSSSSGHDAQAGDVIRTINGSVNCSASEFAPSLYGVVSPEKGIVSGGGDKSCSIQTGSFMGGLLKFLGVFIIFNLMLIASFGPLMLIVAAVAWLCCFWGMIFLSIVNLLTGILGSPSYPKMWLQCIMIGTIAPFAPAVPAVIAASLR